MNANKPLIGTLALALLCAGCSSSGPNTRKGAVGGAVAGGVIGAVIGNNRGSGNAASGAAIGAAAGGLAGAAIAYGLVRTISPLAPAGIPNLSEAAIDARVLTLVALTAIACALIFGLAPGARIARAELRPLLGGRGAGGSQLGGRLRGIFAFTQVAIAMLLAVSAALLGRSYMNLRDIDPGFVPDQVLTMRVSAPSFAYRETSQVRELYRALLDRVKALPGIESAGAIQLMPLTLSNWNSRVVIDGIAAADQYQLDINWRTVTPDYFTAMRIPLKRGRLLTEADEHNALPVTVVNEAFVRTVLRGADPIGRRMRTGFDPRGTWATVVGIVGDVRQHAMAQTPNPEVYRPFAQHPVRTMRLLIRTTGDPVDRSASVRAAIATIDTDIVIADIEPMTAIVDRALGGTRLPLFLAGTLALVALVIGVVGIAGVIAFDVAQRHAEIGIRLALGETPGRIRRAFLMRAAKLGLAGMAAGAAASFGAGQLLEAMLYGVTSTDPTVLLGTAAICMAAVLVASYVPARRASRLDPLMMMRGD
jgi:putative ABC transport system permease protein